MMFEIWLAFVAASAVVLAIPGPTILRLIGQSLGAGRRGALPLVAGVALGDLTAMTLSLAGLGAVLASSATAFTIVQWLGVSLWRAKVLEQGAAPVALPAARACATPMSSPRSTRRASPSTLPLSHSSSRRARPLYRRRRS